MSSLDTPIQNFRVSLALIMFSFFFVFFTALGIYLS